MPSKRRCLPPGGESVERPSAPLSSLSRASSPSSSSSSAAASWTVRCTIPTIIAMTYVVLMLAFHVQAESVDDESTITNPFSQRVQEGPLGLSNLDLMLFGSFILLAFELLQFLVEGSGRWLGAKLIPVRGKHLDELPAKHLIFIGANKLATSPFLYLFLRYSYFERNVIWDPQDISLKNTILPLPALFVVYDFFYTILHWALHIKGIYGCIHKHHHHQKAPSRANVDAVNVHPLEFFLGEYNHMLALFLCCRSLGLQIHVFGCVLFLAVGGVLAGLNHTRYDIVIAPFGLLKLYDSKAHDVHHRVPQSNYGQYTMLWDYIFGSFRPYDPKDRINPMAQLDPSTGKSLEYIKKHKL